VRLTSSSDSVSSLKAKVKMAPGGVHVPTMRWCMGILEARAAIRLPMQDGVGLRMADALELLLYGSRQQ
jgi:hypothetical protein